MVSKIIFHEIPSAEIEDAVITEDDTEPVYYNLQGVKVVNPAKGQLVIKKTTKGSVKTILR